MNYIDLLGKPFKYGGRGPDNFDCYGLAIELYRRAGIEIPDYPSCDDPRTIGDGFLHGAAHYFPRVEANDHLSPQPLDIILFQIVPRWVSHCGVYVGNGRFVHITSKTSVTCEELSHPVWQERMRGVYRFKKLVDGE